MKTRANGHADEAVATLIAKLAEMFPRDHIEAYRYNPAAIRARIIDAKFRGQSMVERESLVLPLIQQLPDEVQSDLTVLLLLTPEERKTSAMNVDFEDRQAISI